MITLRRTSERLFRSYRGQKHWNTFPTRHSATPTGFGALRRLDEEWRPAEAERSMRCRDTEILTYVREGTLSYQDSSGNESTIQAGELHRMTAGDDLRRKDSNASTTEPAHVFQLSLTLAEPCLESSCEQKRFNMAERRGKLCVIASPDGRFGSLRVHGETVLHSAMLSRGQHVVHALAEGRSAWLHVVIGEVAIGDDVLTMGDGAAITSELSVSLTAREQSEILLIELSEPTLVGKRGPADNELGQSE